MSVCFWTIRSSFYLPPSLFAPAPLQCTWSLLVHGHNYDIYFQCMSNQSQEKCSNEGLTSESEISLLVEIHRSVTKKNNCLWKYLNTVFMHFCLLRNGPRSSSTDRILPPGGKIWCLWWDPVLKMAKRKGKPAPVQRNVLSIEYSLQWHAESGVSAAAEWFWFSWHSITCTELRWSGATGTMNGYKHMEQIVINVYMIFMQVEQTKM